MFEIECTINTSVPMQPTKVYLETNFPLSFIQEKKKFINSQFEWKVPSLYFESSAAAKPSLLWLVLVYQGHCIDSCQYH